MDKTEDNPWLQDVYLQTPDGLVVMALDGKILDANPACGRLLGLEPKAARDKYIQDLIPPDQRAKWVHDIEKLIHGTWTVTEGIQLQPAGRQIPIQITLITRTLYANQPVVILHIRDVGVFYTVEQALVASENQWSLSFDAITDSMCILDRNGRILRANQAMIRTFQTLPGTLTGRHYRDIFGCLALPGSANAGDIVSAAPGQIEETTFPNAKGWFCISAYPLKNEQNALTGVILIAKDITESHAMRKILKKNEIGLRQAAKMEAIGRLAGGIAHDFNNLLTSILGYSSLIIRSLKDNDPLRKDLQEILQAGNRATALTRQLLYFSHEQPLETTVIPLNTVIANIESFLRRTIGDDLTLSTRLDQGLWNIRADISRLEQILLNLAINARDAMPNGGQLIIETSNQSLDKSFCQIHPALHPGEYVLLEVSDTGHGMPPEVLEHIFEPFFTTKEKGKGTGLGLTTIYAIVRQFGGYISCYSEINKGTTFKIFLPRCHEPQPDTLDIIPEPALPHGRETVLIVDDELNIVTMISQLLKGLGYQVLSATSSAHALALSEAHPGQIDLVLTDIIMPELRGTELMQVLAKKRPELKVLYMSGYANGMAHQANGLDVSGKVAERDQADVYLQKPFSLQTLAQRVRQALNRPARARAQPGQRE